MKKMQLPYGVQDYMPEECFNKTTLEAKLASVFALHGFERVETPTLEYYDMFNEVLEGKNINRMFKMTDNDGSLLVMRPDTTLQICRMAATKLNLEYITKLYYIENSFEYLPNTSSARNREFAQAGVEMLGDSGDSGDVEILTLAIESLLKTGLDDFLIEIGQAQFFKGLLLEAGIGECDSNILRGLVNNKDMLGVEMFLAERKLGSDFIAKFLLLPTLFGGVSVLDKAKTICSNEMSLKAIQNIQNIMAELAIRGLDKYVSIDLGMVQGDYYSALVIRGVSKNLGVSLLDGGRYDTLCNAFNAPMQAVGFAIGIKRLLIALDNQHKLVDMPCFDYAYISTNSKIEYEIVSKMRTDGKKVTKCFGTKAELIEFCHLKKINKAMVIGENVLVIDVTEGKI